jgi:release factor glutamine methyltransferase
METDIILSLIALIEQALAPCYDSPQLRTQYAWWMLEAISGRSRAELIAQKTVHLTPEQKTLLQTWINRQVMQHEPLQYLIGSVPFLDLTINVRPPILIPRPETEEWCANLITEFTAYQDQPLHILDLCTGSGCIALAFAQAFRNATVYAVDISLQAINLAQENAKQNNISNVQFIYSDLYTSLNPALKFDLIVSNPPYISKEEWNDLDPSVKEWEDYQALVAQDRGLAIIQTIINQAHIWMKVNSPIRQLAIEIGYLQKEPVAALMHKAQLSSVAIVADSAGKPRIARGRVCNAENKKEYC